jgi:hypothetical protein
LGSTSDSVSAATSSHAVLLSEQFPTGLGIAGENLLFGLAGDPTQFLLARVGLRLHILGQPWPHQERQRKEENGHGYD